MRYFKNKKVNILEATANEDLIEQMLRYPDIYEEVMEDGRSLSSTPITETKAEKPAPKPVAKKPATKTKAKAKKAK